MEQISKGFRLCCYCNRIYSVHDFSTHRITNYHRLNKGWKKDKNGFWDLQNELVLDPEVLKYRKPPTMANSISIILE